MGYIMEKEQSFRDAANCYESAWKQTQNPSIGLYRHRYMWTSNNNDNCSSMKQTRSAAKAHNILSIDKHIYIYMNRLQAGIQLPQRKTVCGRNFCMSSSVGDLSWLPEDQERSDGPGPSQSSNVAWKTSRKFTISINKAHTRVFLKLSFKYDRIQSIYLRCFDNHHRYRGQSVFQKNFHIS